MHVDRIPDRTSPPAFLLRETYREGGKVRKRTLANITHWSAAKIEALRRLLRDEVLGGDQASGLKLLRSLPHGHVAAGLGMLRKVGLDRVLSRGGQQPAHAAALDRASGWGIFPTPIPDILDAAKLKIAPASAFDPRRIMEYLIGKAERAASTLKSAISKVFGIYDADECLIHIDQNVRESKQNFLKLHEAGHHELPTHRKLFRIFQDCEKTLEPEIADLFEREANNFARFVLFQGDGYRVLAADHKFEIKTPMKLAGKFGASIYASCREYARTNHRACVVYVLEPITYCEKTGARAEVRRIEASPLFEQQFGRPTEQVITLNHSLGNSCAATPLPGSWWCSSTSSAAW
jgi:hypothetical protein